MKTLREIGRVSNEVVKDGIRNGYITNIERVMKNTFFILLDSGYKISEIKDNYINALESYDDFLYDYNSYEDVVKCFNEKSDIILNDIIADNIYENLNSSIKEKLD